MQSYYVTISTNTTTEHHLVDAVSLNQAAIKGRNILMQYGPAWEMSVWPVGMSKSQADYGDQLVRLSYDEVGS